MNGDVRLRVEGLMLERLLERAIQEGARFRAVEPPEDHVMTIYADPHGMRWRAACASARRRWPAWWSA